MFIKLFANEKNQCKLLHMHYILLVVFMFSSSTFAQVSMSDINKLNNQQIDALKAEFNASQESQNIVSDNNSDAEVEALDQVSIVSDDNQPVDLNYFGYNYFKSDINFFDNIPTPENFKLGPGDEITLSLWGEINRVKKFTINKDGSIYYENIGFINLSNKTVEEAQTLLIEKLSEVYSTLNDKDNPSSLRIDLGKLKSVNVYFSGEIENPGIQLVHPFADVFSAIVQSGGIKTSGSLRNVQLIRKGKVVDIFDFYDFFTNGKNTFSNTRIIDGDTIHIPVVKNRIQISGQVYTQAFFEFLESDSLKDILVYTGGFTANVGSKFFLNRIIPVEDRQSDDYARFGESKVILDNLDMLLEDGDTIFITGITDVSTEVSINGRVKNPGKYPANGLTLKDLLMLAGGFDDPIYLQSIQTESIVVLRKDSNQFYSLFFDIPYKESDSFNLNVEDQVFVYENINFNKVLIVTINGEIKNSGSYPLKEDMTVGDLIDKAGGFTARSNPSGIIVKDNFLTINNNFEQETLEDFVNDISLDFKLSNGSIVTVQERKNVVNVAGNVYNPGLVAYYEGKTLKKYIQLAGGMKKNSLKRDIYVSRANGKIKRVSILGGLGVIIQPGDTIYIPEDPDPQDFDITAFVADFAVAIANIAAILIVVDNQSN